MRRTLARPASAAVLALTLGLGLSACGGKKDSAGGCPYVVCKPE